MDFSILIPTYNIATVVERAIRSAAEQTLAPLEILVIDDCSTDGTVDVVQSLQREIPALKLVRTQVNGGPSAARNVGFETATGEWIALLDGDDAWKPERLEKMSEVIRMTNADWIADNVILWDIIADKPLRLAFESGEKIRSVTPLDFFQNDNDFNFTRFSWGTLKPIFRRAFIEEHSLRYHEDLRTGEDFTMYADMLFSGAKAFLMSDAYYIYSVPYTAGGASPHSRSRHNFSKFIDIGHEQREKYKDQIDDKLALAMDRRDTTLTLIHQSNIARGYRRNGEYAQYVRYVSTKPALVANLFFRAVKSRFAK